MVAFDIGHEAEHLLARERHGAAFAVAVHNRTLSLRGALAQQDHL